MKVKYLLMTLLIAMVAGAGTAQASTTLSLGSLSIGMNEDAQRPLSPGMGNFNDHWTLLVGGQNDLYIEFNDAELYSSTIGNILNITGMNVNGGVDLIFSNVGDRWFYHGNLPDGPYTITVSGLADGLAGGIYTASLRAAPVPIPPAALLFGSALAGLAAFRRRKKI